MKYNFTPNCNKKFFWQEPKGNDETIWRYENNPIIDRNCQKHIKRVFNSGVATYKDKFVGVFRAETDNGAPYLFVGWSDDSINWKINPEKISFIDENGKSFDPIYSYDPRLLKIEDCYYIIWCTEFDGPTIAIAKTTDFEKFEILPFGFLPFNRNGVLFPEKVNGKYLMLSRPSDNGHTPFGDIFISESPDMIHWGKHKILMKKTMGDEWWSNLKIGAGPAPIKTEDGWLLIFHGVIRTCNGYVYSMGAALLDLDNPSVVKKRAERFLMTPEMPYEEKGFVDNVVFPCAALCDKEGHLTIYYGASDTYLAIAFSTIDKLVDFVKNN